MLVGYLVLAAVLTASGMVLTHLLTHNVGAWDEHVNSWFAHHRGHTANRLAGDFTLLADTQGIAVVTALAVGITLSLHRARLGVMVLIAIATELAVFLTANYSVSRPRPHVSHVGPTPSTFSWPSGHVAATLALYGGIALIVMTMTTRLLPRTVAWLVAGCVVAGVALSRVYEGEHHPTDAIAGLLLGAGALWVATRTVRAWRYAVNGAGGPP